MEQIPLLIDYRGFSLSVLVSYKADETAEKESEYMNSPKNMLIY